VLQFADVICEHTVLFLFESKMVLDVECMLLDPASVVERYEREVEKSMASRHDQLDRNFDKYEERKDIIVAARIRAQVRNISELEAIMAWEDCSNEEEAAILKLSSSDYINQIRKTIETRCYPQEPKNFKRPRPNKPSATSDSGWEQSQRMAVLDQMASMDDADTSSWSDARRESYSRFHEAPNSYLYYYRLPGEEQRHGPWDGEEHELFLQLLEAAGGWEAARMPEMQWGLFSAGLTGRVGYQCSNHFLQLDREKRRRLASTFRQQHPRRAGEADDDGQDADSASDERDDDDDNPENEGREVEEDEDEGNDPQG
jgi:hypothetical protein